MPTYIGIRLLLEHFAADDLDEALEQYLIYSSATHNVAFDHHWNTFKSKSDDGITYRPMVHAKPTKVLGDSLALSLIPECLQHEQSPHSYSYRLSTGMSCRQNYDTYFSGYRDRNKHIGELLTNDDAKVFCFDLKSFYHLVSKDRLRTCVQSHALPDAELGRKQRWARDYILDFVECLPESGGLPVGCELSHYLADLYLETLDEDLESRYAGRVFRYVDDFAFVGSTGERTKILQDMTLAIGRVEGLELNPEKQIEFTRAQWQKATSFSTEGVRSGSFEALTYAIRLYSLGGKSTEGLKEALHDQGMRIPVAKLIEKASDPDYRANVADLVNRGVPGAMEGIRGTAIDVVRQADQLKVSLLAELRRTQEDPDWQNEGPSIYLSKRMRYLANRSLYLATNEDLSEAVQLCAARKCCHEFQACASAVLTESLVPLLEMPGKSIWSFMEVLDSRQIQNIIEGYAIAHGIAELKTTTEDSVMGPVLGDILASGVDEPRLTTIPKAEGCRRYLSACCGTFALREVEYGGKYVDELGGLLSTTTADIRKAILANPMYEDEIRPLWTLMLDGNYYSS